MHQGGAVQQLDGGGGGVGDARKVLAAGAGDRQAKPRPDPGAARKNRVAHGGSQLRRTAGGIGAAYRREKAALDPRHDIHGCRPVVTFDCHRGLSCNNDTCVNPYLQEVPACGWR